MVDSTESSSARPHPKRASTATAKASSRSVSSKGRKKSEEAIGRLRGGGLESTPTPTESSSRSSSKKGIKNQTEKATSSQSKGLQDKKKSATKTSADSSVGAPQTPASMNMDSDLDDDMNSVASSDGFNMEEDGQNSDISLDDGTCHSTCLAWYTANLYQT